MGLVAGSGIRLPGPSKPVYDPPLGSTENAPEILTPKSRSRYPESIDMPEKL